MAPTVAVQVQQLTFNELLCHLAAAHDREVVELRTEIKQLRNCEGSSSSSASGSNSVLEMSSFPSRQPTLAGNEDCCEPLPEDTECITPERTEDLPRAPQPVGQSSSEAERAASCIKLQTIPDFGPDVNALACALQVARSLGLSAIAEDQAVEVEDEAEILFGGASRSASRVSGQQLDAEYGATSAVLPENQASTVSQSTLSCTSEHSAPTLPQVTPTNPSLVPAPPLSDDEPLPEEDKSGINGSPRGGSIDAFIDAVPIPGMSDSTPSTSSPTRTSSSEKGSASPPNFGRECCGREWSIDVEKTGDANVRMTVNPCLDAGMGLSSAIWLEVSDMHRAAGPSSPTRESTWPGQGEAVNCTTSPTRESTSTGRSDAAGGQRGSDESEASYVDIQLTSPSSSRQAFSPENPEANLQPTLDSAPPTGSVNGIVGF